MCPQLATISAAQKNLSSTYPPPLRPKAAKRGNLNKDGAPNSFKIWNSNTCSELKK